MNGFSQRIAPLLKPRNRRLLFHASTLVAVGGLIGWYWPELTFTGRTIKRATRTAWTVGVLSFDYKRHFPSSSSQRELGEQEWHRRKSVIHTRAARKLLELFQRNGGIYIKVGQHLSALEYILPVEYCSTMSVLHSKAPESSMAEVSTVILEDLGAPLEEIFAEFDKHPIGAASLAQVHRAILHTGETVAVKVQHKRLQSHTDSDMFVISCAVKAVKRIFPEFDFDWIADEMRINLPRELDFLSEGHNAERVMHNFRQGLSSLVSRHELRIPKVYWRWTSKRVLTMEYLPGAQATDLAFLREQDIEPRKVSSLITRVFSEMIFLHGFVHCDPHPGNLLIRPQPYKWNWWIRWLLPMLRSRPFELVLIDHGLYREIPDEYRRNYAGLWCAVINADEAQMKHYAELVGGGDAYRLFSCILTQRSWSSVVSGDISSPRSANESAEIVAKAPQYLSKVAELLAKVPRPLLLLLKTNDLLRHLERALTGGSHSKTFILMAHYCIDALYEDQLLHSQNHPLLRVRAWLWQWWQHLYIHLIELTALQ